MKKTYNVSDLFFTRWEDLSPKQHAIVYTLQQECEHARRLEGSDGSVNIQYGVKLISVLRNIRRNKLLVDKINVLQAVDIYNDLSFLKAPWYFFPDLKLKWGKTPAEKMARHTFDHFIYADNEYSSYVASNDKTFLRRLVATLYQENFDKEDVGELEPTIKLEDWQLYLVLFTYVNVRGFVVKRCKTLLPPSAGTSEKAAPTGAMWLTLKHRLAETPAFQGYDTTGKANMYAALDYLEDLSRQKERNAKH